MNIENFQVEMEEKVEAPNHGIWVEKYRPRRLEDFIGSEWMHEKVKSWLESKEIPHLLFYSKPGTGKSSLAKLLIDKIPCDGLEINASDKNGVDDIRNEIQDFCMTMGFQPIKIMFLDEADRLTPDAQKIMNNLMEAYSQSTRFILTCNHPEKISPALKSRCQSFEINPPSMPDVMQHVVKVLKAEDITFDMKDVAFIVKSYYPDMRKTINTCQQYTINKVLKLAKVSTADQDYKDKLVALLKTPNKAGVFTEIRQLVADAMFSNYEEVYKHLFERVDEYAPNKQAEIILNLADSSYQSALVFEREITFVAAMHKLLTVLNRK